MIGVLHFDCPTPTANESPITRSRRGDALVLLLVSFASPSTTTVPDFLMIPSTSSKGVDGVPGASEASIVVVVVVVDDDALEEIHLTMPCDGANGRGESPYLTRYLRIATEPWMIAMVGSAKIEMTTAENWFVIVHVTTPNGAIIPNNQSRNIFHPVVGTDSFCRTDDTYHLSKNGTFDINHASLLLLLPLPLSMPLVPLLLLSTC
mmetsp:Transcript_32146/g.78358  ORF Transcript_32146/g.78358 Transcript_32146/m.78358 type:complete len:206 (-) Transcript_32146:832-1449(-)